MAIDLAQAIEQYTMRFYLIIFLAFLSCFSSQKVQAQIILNQETLNKTVADKAFELEDPNRELTIEQVISQDTFDFQSIQKPLEILDFTHSRWFIRFEVQNPRLAKDIIFETARPITDRVDLYEVSKGEIVQSWKNGDSIPFSEKAIYHRKNLFHLHFASGETKHFYLVLESDGEVINLPMRFWEKHAFYKADNQYNLFHGFYFGVLALVIFIFFFFYLLLKEKTFLYYILYVFFHFMLQFSLEGFTHQFIFPNALYFSGISTVISAAGTAVFVVFYATNYLHVRSRSIKWSSFYRVLLLALGITIVMALIPGFTRIISYPLVNVLTLIGGASITITIFSFKRKGYTINNAFLLGFLILIAGGILFILGNMGIFGDARVSELSLKISSGLEVLALSISMAQRYKELQEEKENIQKEALAELESLVDQRTHKIKEQQEELVRQNKSVLDSIRYAQRIQAAILPTESHVKNVLPESFILYEPRDIVSGDFYFVERVTTESGEKLAIFAAVDCTGHGVPGAFMSFLGNNYLNQSIKVRHVNTPGEALDFLNEGVYTSLKIKEYKKKGISIRDGMDMTLCGLNSKTNKLYFAGAKNSIIIITKKENLKTWEQVDFKVKILESEAHPEHILVEVKGNKQAIGFDTTLIRESFDTRIVPIHQNDLIYSYSDGFPDQFGGAKNKKFGTRRFKKLLLSVHHLGMEEQKAEISKALHEWKGEVERLDDILVMGVRVVDR